MSNFALNSTDPYGDVIDSINYLLATSNPLNANTIVTSANALVANVSSGQITTAADPAYVSYLFQYLHVRYADNATGSVNFSTSPTNRLFFGLLNSNSTVGSNNPADYIYTQVVGGFGTTKFFFYSVLGGRQILINITTGLANNFLQAVDGVPIDLDLVTAVANVVITANNIVASTITGTEIAANTVATTNITNNAVSFFGSDQRNSPFIVTTPTANLNYSLSTTIIINNQVANSKIYVSGQNTQLYYVTVGTPFANASLKSNLGLRFRDVAQATNYLISSQEVDFTFTTTGTFQLDHEFYETGVAFTLPNVGAAGEYGFGVYSRYITTGNITVAAFESQQMRNTVQNLKR